MDKECFFNQGFILNMISRYRYLLFWLPCLISSQNEPPSYYSIEVQTQPPLKSYEEVVYGVGPGLTPPAYPQYIPQYGPPAAPAQVQLSIREWHPQLAFLTAQWMPVWQPDKWRLSRTKNY